jgi:hypothetical protein
MRSSWCHWKDVSRLHMSRLHMSRLHMSRLRMSQLHMSLIYAMERELSYMLGRSQKLG